MTPPPRASIRLYLTADSWIGPGKAALLQGIADTGSIAAAGRTMGMSYKRAWMLVEALNAMFASPLVTSARGGAHGGGAVLTETGARVLALYQGFSDTATRVGATELAQLAALKSDMSDGK